MRGLRERLEALAAHGEGRGAAAILDEVDRSLRADAHRARVAAAGRSAAAGLAVALLAVLAVIALGGSASDRSVTTATGRGADGGLFVPRSGGVAPFMLVPASVPSGFHVIRASGGDQPDLVAGRWVALRERMATWVQLDEDGRWPVAFIELTWGPSAAAEGYREPLGAHVSGWVDRAVRGRDGRYSPELGVLVWDEPAGQTVTITGRRFTIDQIDTARGSGSSVVGQPFTAEELTALADRLTLAGAGGFQLSEPPPGFHFAAEMSAGASTGRNPRDLVFASSDGRGLHIRVVNDSEIPPGVNVNPAFGAQLVRVRGTDAVLTPRLFQLLDSQGLQSGLVDGQVLYLQWIEPGNVQVTMRAVGMTRDEVLALAEGLRAIDADEWAALKAAIPAATK